MGANQPWRSLGGSVLRGVYPPLRDSASVVDICCFICECVRGWVKPTRSKNGPRSIPLNALYARSHSPSVFSSLSSSFTFCISRFHCTAARTTRTVRRFLAGYSKKSLAPNCVIMGCGTGRWAGLRPLFVCACVRACVCGCTDRWIDGWMVCVCVCVCVLWEREGLAIWSSAAKKQRCSLQMSAAFSGAQRKEVLWSALEINSSIQLHISLDLEAVTSSDSAAAGQNMSPCVCVCACVRFSLLSTPSCFA